MTNFDMAGYGIFIWPSYALAGLFVCGCILHSLIRAHNIAKSDKAKDLG
jgi:heme exporter protein CcmD